jgi:glycosyltransferase involved in cell wall biosynthesis
MEVLFIHQNFPGQFKFLAPALKQQGHGVRALAMQAGEDGEWNGIPLHRYSAVRPTTPNISSLVGEYETKVVRGESCFQAAMKLKENGYQPDVIIAHPGWGESLFVKEVWPDAKLGIYCEFYYHSTGADVGFDPEFLPDNIPVDHCRIRLKNVNNLMHFQIAEAGISPTEWQASTYPSWYRDKITVVHDGIDTDTLIPDSKVSLTLNDKLVLTKEDEVITFVNRNLEPYRGYHVFMRALPRLLKERPRAHVLIVGGDGVSYGQKAPAGDSWKEIFAREIRPEVSIEDWERVHFLGTIPYNHFIPLLQLSTVHVYLTYPFVLSWSLLEAMSIGCAIVASDTRPLHEAIKHDETGRLVDFFDKEKLVDQISSLLDDASERERLGKNARAHAVANYDLLKVCLPKQLAWVLNMGNV